jgi:hypothetical protein
MFDLKVERRKMRVYRSKLSRDAILEIYNNSVDGNLALSECYGCSRGTALNIRQGRSHVAITQAIRKECKPRGIGRTRRPSQPPVPVTEEEKLIEQQLTKSIEHDFILMVDKCMDGGSDCLQCCLRFAEERNIEPDFLGQFIQANPRLFARITAESENLHFIKRTVRKKYDH